MNIYTVNRMGPREDRKTMTFYEKECQKLSKIKIDYEKLAKIYTSQERGQNEHVQS